MQNICFAIYSYALLQYESLLTPLILFVVILITVGMREVGAALSNPFGNDDVDFPVDQWIAKLRSVAIVAHPSNRIIRRPPGKKVSAGLDGANDGADGDEKHEEQEEHAGHGGEDGDGEDADDDVGGIA